MRRSCTVVEELYGGAHQAEDAFLNQTGRIGQTVWTMEGLWFDGWCSVPVTQEIAFQFCIRVILFKTTCSNLSSQSTHANHAEVSRLGQPAKRSLHRRDMAIERNTSGRRSWDPSTRR